jgi:hypothetical protein
MMNMDFWTTGNIVGENGAHTKYMVILVVCLFEFGTNLKIKCMKGHTWSECFLDMPMCMWSLVLNTAAYLGGKEPKKVQDS